MGNNMESKVENEAKEKANINQYLNELKGIERDYMKEVLDSRAWWKKLGIGGLVIGLIGGVAAYSVLPLKTSIPFVMKYDSKTGVVESLSILEPATITTDDALDGYWAGQYILARESYNYYQVQTTYDKTMVMSEDDAKSSYDSQFVGNNALDKQYRDSVEIKAELVSKTLSPFDPKQDKYRTIMVRFIKTIIKPNQKPDKKPYIATISFHYVNDVMTEKDRNLNPMGFKVVSYNAVSEVIR